MCQQEPYYIIDSKRMCKESGMNPNVIARPKSFLDEEDLYRKRKSYSEILSVVSFFSNKLLDFLKGTPILIVISDSNGFLLDMVGDKTIKSTVEQFGIKVGSLFTQEDTGTNVISLSLQQRHPISLIGKNHYHTFLHQVACYGAAFHYTDEDSLLGSVCIMMPISFQNPLFLTMLSQAVDSIERELLLRKQNKILNIMNQIMLCRTRNGIVITDEKGITTEFNDFAQQISNLSKSSVIGKCIYDSELTGNYFKRAIEHEEKFENEELKFINKNGDQVVCLFDAQPIYEDDRIVGAFGQFRDITDRYLLEEKYNYLAYHDDLTGLPNRRYIQKDIESLLLESTTIESKPKIAILFLDLDRFKVINDTFGHSNGDVLLVEVAKRLVKCLGENDKLARMGGDEFIFLLKDFDDENYVIEKAEQILEQFNDPFMVKKNEFHTTVSIGIATYPNYTMSPEEFMVNADTAMYKAKSQGKNRYIIYTTDMLPNMFDIKLETDLRKALERDEFLLHYQPKVCNKTGELVGVEALIRWNHPELGVIYPVKFIKLAEETGLITQIGEWVIEQACFQNKKWQNTGIPSFKIAVNLSTQQFLKQDIVCFIKKVLERTKLEPQYLIIEITESMTMDFDYSLRVLEELKSIGVLISIDDFGTGYSSLSYLKKFPIDYLKIDRSFVRDIMNDENDANIVKAIITLAHNLNLQVIAEGVETREQLAFLKKYHCDTIQGFLFSKPLTIEQFEQNYAELLKDFKIKIIERDKNY